MVSYPGYRAQQGSPVPPHYGPPSYEPLVPNVPPQQPAEVKWGGLSKGGLFKVPVIAFIGRLADVQYDTQSQFGMRIVEKYDQVQILESLAPWPWATIDISIKYSEREDSSWGRHVSSAKALGVAQDASTFDQAKVELCGKVYELRQAEENYGEDQHTGQKFKGDVWRFVRIVGQGGVALPAQPIQGVLQYVPPTPTTPVVPTTVQPTVGFSSVLAPTDTSAVRAKKLLHGRALNEFLGVALVDSVIKADSALVNSIFDQSLIVGLKASGQVVLGPDGKFQVIG